MDFIRTSPLYFVLKDVLGEIHSIEDAIALVSALYCLEFSIREEPSGVYQDRPSMRVAAQLVEALFVGERNDLYKYTTPGYEYSYWLGYICSPLSAELRGQAEILADRLRSHPSVLKIELDCDA